MEKCLETRGVDALADSGPFGQLWSSCQRTTFQGRIRKFQGAHTMYSLPVTLLLPVENRILVLGQHFLLQRHLPIPPLHGLCLQSAFLIQGLGNSVDNAVDGA